MAIIVMNDGTELNFDNDFSSTILAEAVHCKKICFDLSLLKKKDKVYSAYHIPQSEKILAFCKDVAFIPLTIEGIVFTDQAVYRCPAIKLEDGSEYNRISYKSLDSCIITQEGPKGGVYVCTQNHCFSLHGPSLVSQNVAGYEIRQIMCKVQRQLFIRDTSAKNKVDSLAKMLLQKAKSEMGIDELPSKTLGILDCLMDFPEHADTAAMIKAEYLFREFRPDKYDKFAATLPILISPDAKATIKSIPAAFYDNYMRLLADFEQELSYKSLSPIYKRIGSLEKRHIKVDIIQACLCVRMVEHSWIDTHISELRRNYGRDVAETIERFRCNYFNHEMYKVYTAITRGSDYPDTYLRLRDGLGLTPLHYAIILKNEEAIRHLLDQKDWKYASPYGSCAKPFQMYEYVVAAAGNQLPNIQEILLKTNMDVIELRDTIKTIKGKLKFQGAVNWVQDTNLIAHRMDYANKKAHHASKGELERISANIDAIKENLNTAEDNAANLEEMLRSCEDSIPCVMENAIDEALCYLEEMRTNNYPLASYLHRIFFEPDFFERVQLATKDRLDLRLYHYEGFYFLAPAFANINLPYQGQSSSTQNINKGVSTSNIPPYGNSWFSNEAHHSIDTLKLEYRKLAKTYHPDVCKLPNSSDLFKAISTEYSQLYHLIVYGKARP